MNLHLPFFNFNSMRTRAIFAGAGAASFYGWIQYTSPDTLLGLLDVNSMLADPLNPMIIIPPLAAAGVLLPKFIKLPGRISLPKQNNNSASNTQYTGNGATLLEFGKNQDTKGSSVKDVVPVQTVSASAAPPSSTSSPAQTKDSSQQPAAPANPTGGATIVESKTSKVVEEVESVKKEVSSIRDDVQSLKTDIKELSSTFESSLVELKAFQSEMVNPINFMRKYFELLDIKNVSDPVNAMMPPIEQLVNNVNNNTTASDAKQGGNGSSAMTEPTTSRAKRDVIKNQDDSKIIEKQNAGGGNNTTTNNKAKMQTTDDEFSIEDAYEMIRRQQHQEGFEEDDEEDEEEQYGGRKYHRRNEGQRPDLSSLARSRIKSRNQMRKRSSSMFGSENDEFLRSSLESGLTPGKIMSIVSIVDEILASMGPDGIELVLEQYRAIGLRPEEERLIYGVVKMLNESKLLTDDIIAMLYRFGQVLGINDQDAELQYMKIVANKRNKKKRLTRDLTSKEE
jgi:hypothetical protein